MYEVDEAAAGNSWDEIGVALTSMSSDSFGFGFGLGFGFGAAANEITKDG